MLVVSVSVAGLVTLAAMTQPSLAPEARTSLLQYVTGKYLLPANCKVQFDWSDPQVVGETMCFIVRFFQRNGQPYPICDTDQFFVEVTEGTRKVVTVSELGAAVDPCQEANIAKVKFPVRAAGQYHIAVSIGSNHVAGSPFVKTFLPGTMDARRSRLVRPANTLVCCAGAPTMLHIEPKDEFGNSCLVSSVGCVSTVDAQQVVEGYDVELFDLNDVQINEKMRSAVTFAHDKLNARIAVSAQFPEPICLKAAFSYRGQKLPNGEFDVIVLSSKYTGWGWGVSCITCSWAGIGDLSICHSFIAMESDDAAAAASLSLSLANIRSQLSGILFFIAEDLWHQNCTIHRSSSTSSVV